MSDQDPHQPPDPPPYHALPSDSGDPRHPGKADASEADQGPFDSSGSGHPGWQPIIPPYGVLPDGTPPYAMHPGSVPPYTPHPYVPHPYQPHQGWGPGVDSGNGGAHMGDPPPYAPMPYGIPPYVPNPYMPSPYVPNPSIPHPYTPHSYPTHPVTPGGSFPHPAPPEPYIPSPYVPGPSIPGHSTPGPSVNAPTNPQAIAGPTSSFDSGVSSAELPKTAVSGLDPNLDGGSASLHAATDPTLSGIHGWSLWRYDGQQWELKVDQSVAGASPGVPSALSGKFVGQMVRTPSVPRERDDTALQADVANDPEFMEEIVQRASEIPGYASTDELRWIVGTASNLQPGSKWVEVGTMCGRSFLAAGLSLPKGSTLVTIDSFLGQQMRRGQTIFDVYRELTFTRWDLSVVLTKAASVFAASMIPDQSCQVVYLDGDHSGAGVRADLTAWAPKLAPGGLLCGHDYGHAAYPGLRQAVDALPGSAVAVESIWVWHP